MSDLFRNLANQGAGESDQNIQYWLDWGESEEGKAQLAKEKAGTLEERDKPWVAAYHLYAEKAKERGVERGKAASDSTGVPDLTDSRVRARRMAQTLSLMSGRGRKQSFLGGDYSADELGGGSMLGGAP